MSAGKQPDSFRNPRRAEPLHARQRCHNPCEAAGPSEGSGPDEGWEWAVPLLLHVRGGSYHAVPWGARSSGAHVQPPRRMDQAYTSQQERRFRHQHCGHRGAKAVVILRSHRTHDAAPRGRGEEHGRPSPSPVQGTGPPELPTVKNRALILRGAPAVLRGGNRGSKLRAHSARRSKKQAGLLGRGRPQPQGAAQEGAGTTASGSRPEARRGSLLRGTCPRAPRRRSSGTGNSARGGTPG